MLRLHAMLTLVLMRLLHDNVPGQSRGQSKELCVYSCGVCSQALTEAVCHTMKEAAAAVEVHAA